MRSCFEKYAVVNPFPVMSISMGFLSYAVILKTCNMGHSSEFHLSTVQMKTFRSMSGKNGLAKYLVAPHQMPGKRPRLLSVSRAAAGSH
jgi:hypothetical protein